MLDDNSTLFDLRGNFVDPYLQDFQSGQLQYLYGMTDAFALDDERALIVAHARDRAQVRNTCVMLINIRSQEVYWRIACRLSYRAALVQAIINGFRVSAQAFQQCRSI